MLMILFQDKKQAAVYFDLFIKYIWLNLIYKVRLIRRFDNLLC